MGREGRKGGAHRALALGISKALAESLSGDESGEGDHEWLLRQARDAEFIQDDSVQAPEATWKCIKIRTGEHGGRLDVKINGIMVNTGYFHKGQLVLGSHCAAEAMTLEVRGRQNIWTGSMELSYDDQNTFWDMTCEANCTGKSSSTRHMEVSPNGYCRHYAPTCCAHGKWCTIEAKNLAYDGDQGLKGFVGLSGWKGPRGHMGTQGNTGEQGREGDQGPRGIKGATGHPGIRGQEGYQGALGYTGSPGEPGEHGFRGYFGHTGVPGVLGVLGYPGNPGPPGPPGDLGDPGLGGDPGQMGLPGRHGPPGPRGKEGEEGAKGPRGKSAPPLPIIDCAWGEWADWEVCSATCGKNIQRRRERSIKRYPQDGGHNCEGSKFQLSLCWLLACTHESPPDSSLFQIGNSKPVEVRKQEVPVVLAKAPVVPVAAARGGGGEKHKGEHEKDSRGGAEGAKVWRSLWLVPPCLSLALLVGSYPVT